ncbi:PQQ-binding-like beta-propeller repeat protein [Neorhodopirellula pilleata]|uniref:Outer membrane biogenesis protein BamB n=1 Tax=Neorhodopirellula pilleata TaxID=2714738 RepID=A0A5C6A8M5_9BACT|nr:PQQ-binding-like beta-propeller repeat protein [Neorhodopirellula pilleata]TWT95747.1 outer membrane biogenesis protein BamB [Neorhodopirellula pilleata]
MIHFSRSGCFAICMLALSASTGIVGWATKPTSADEWSVFRGPRGDGIADADSNVPTEWSPSKNIAFRTPLPGQGWSSPVISDGRIYLTTAIAQNEEADAKDSQYDLTLIILDSKSGEILKTVALMQQTAEKSFRIHKKNSHASPTPIVEGDRVFVHFGYQGTACVDRDGNLIWKNRELFFKPVHGNGGTPVLVDGKLIFTCDGANDPKVVALEAETGKIAWEVERPIDAKKKFSFCTPLSIVVGGQKQVIAPGSDCVLAIDPADGSVIWQLLYSGYSVIPKPVYHDGLVFLSTSYDTPSMLAIDPTGEGDVTETHLKWSIAKNAPHTPSMLADEQLIYSVSDDGIAMCVEASTGDIVYKKRVGGNFSASPILVNNKIFYTNESGVTTVIATGRQYEVLAENDLGERTLASAAVDGNALIMRTADAIYRIEE